MRKRLMMWLSCPLCSGNLDLHSATVSRAPASDTDRRVLSAVAPIADADQIDIDITTGALSCASCRVYYPIFNSVPRMLTYWTKVAGLHAEENAAWVKEELIGFALPASPVPPGEQEVLRNFSTEWTRYKWSGKSYWSATPARVLDWMRFSLGTSRHTLRGKLALDAGMGIGGIADGLSRSEDCEIIGLDLSYAVDQASAYFGRNCRLHIGGGVHVHSNAPLPVIGGAIDDFRAELGGGQRRQKHRGQNRNDRNHNQQFDQGKADRRSAGFHRIRQQ